MSGNMVPNSEFMAVNVELTRAVRELSEILRKSTDQGKATASAGSAAASVASSGAAGTPGGQGFWSQGAQGAAGSFGLSAVRQMLSATGSSGMASLAGGLASGGVAGLGVAAVGQIANIARDYQGVHDSGRDAANSMAAGAGFTGREASRRFGEQQGRQDFVEKYGESRLFNFGFEYGKGFTTYDKAQRGNDAVRNFDRQKVEDRNEIAKSAIGRTMQEIGQLAAFTKIGHDPGDNEKATNLVDTLYKFNLKQAQSVQHTQRYVELIDSHLNRVSPGSQGTLSNK